MFQKLNFWLEKLFAPHNVFLCQGVHLPKNFLELHRSTHKIYENSILLKICRILDLFPAIHMLSVLRPTFDVCHNGAKNDQGFYAY